MPTKEMENSHKDLLGCAKIFWRGWSLGEKKNVHARGCPMCVPRVTWNHRPPFIMHSTFFSLTSVVLSSNRAWPWPHMALDSHPLVRYNICRVSLVSEVRLKKRKAVWCWIYCLLAGCNYLPFVVCCYMLAGRLRTFFWFLTG